MDLEKDLNIRIYQPADEAQVIELWCECGLLVPWNNPKADIDRKYSDSTEMFFVADLYDELVATCMAGFDGHRGWIYFLAVKLQFQHQGIASKMLGYAESALQAVACPKLELMVRESNDRVISFYQNNGYQKRASGGIE